MVLLVLSLPPPIDGTAPWVRWPLQRSDSKARFPKQVMACLRDANGEPIQIGDQEVARLALNIRCEGGLSTHQGIRFF